MAQRAIRDGRNLDFAAYRDYSEWAPTRAMEEKGWSGVSTAAEKQGDLVMTITRCPWHQQFRQMGLTDAGAVYCTYLDKSICRGFNPELVFDVEKTLNTSDCCIQIMRKTSKESLAEAGNHTGQDKTPGEDKADRVRNFEYHCAHIWYAFSAVTEAVFGNEGSSCSKAVLDAFIREFGEEAAGIIVGYKGTDFNVCG